MTTKYDLSRIHWDDGSEYSRRFTTFADGTHEEKYSDDEIEWAECL